MSPTRTVKSEEMERERAGANTGPRLDVLCSMPRRMPTPHSEYIDHIEKRLQTLRLMGNVRRVYIQSDRQINS